MQHTRSEGCGSCHSLEFENFPESSVCTCLIVRKPLKSKSASFIGDMAIDFSNINTKQQVANGE